MREPKHISVQSITTQDQQELWIGKEKYGQFQGKKLCFIDDVVSTGAPSIRCWPWRRKSALRFPSSPAC